MRRAGFCLVVIATIVIRSSPLYAEEPKPDAMLSLTQTSVALFFGYTWGTGVLTYGDKTYPVEMDGFSVLSLGFAQAEATGEVFNLKKLEDFNGTYMAGSVKGTPERERAPQARSRSRVQGHVRRGASRAVQRRPGDPPGCGEAAGGQSHLHRGRGRLH